MAIIVVAAGIALPIAGAGVARAMGWEQTLVGTLFVAAATTAPELAVTIAAVRIGAFEMAIANLLGSTVFDLFIVAVADAFYAKGPLLAHVSQANLLPAATAIAMIAIVVVGFRTRPARKVLGVAGWPSLALVAAYAAAAWALSVWAS